MFLKSIRLKNLLSFTDASLSFHPLNVIIGPNASGKTNLVSAIELLRAAPLGPSGLPRVIPEGGGIREWISKRQGVRTATIEADFSLANWPSLSYALGLGEEKAAYVIEEEKLFERTSGRGNGAAIVFVDRTISSAKMRHSAGGDQEFHPMRHESALSLFRDPRDKTPLTSLAAALSDIRVFRAFDTSPLAVTRAGVPVATASGFLSDKGENLAMVLQAIQYDGKIQPLNEQLRRCWEDVEEIRILLERGVAITAIKEAGIETPTPASRLSDGTLKFLCLMAILKHPAPPSLICMEEPELGLHPDAMAIVADALRDASSRCQIIVTTHSAELVTALSKAPDSVVVCERGADRGTNFTRLKASKLALWLENYSLGELWRKGEIGGNRW